jgi:hypothetical protein
MVRRIKQKSDVLEYCPQTNFVRYISSVIVRKRRITLEGIDVMIVQSDEGMSMDPMIPAFGPLSALINENQKADRFVWDRRNYTWSAVK